MTSLLELFEIVKPGVSMSLQGMPVPASVMRGLPAGGAMDPLAPRVLNQLLGLNPAAPVLECTLQGPVLVARENLIVALGGIEGSAAIPMWEAVPLKSGETLNLRNLMGACRLYIAAVKGANAAKKMLRLRPESLIRRPEQGPVAVIPNPRTDRVPLARTTFRLSPDSDRKGLRLTTQNPIAAGREIPPEPMGYGAIQLPPDGAPIIVGPDGPVTGGYLRMATVAQADLRKLAYWMPGQTLEFEPMHPDEARRRQLSLEDMLARDLIPC